MRKFSQLSTEFVPGDCITVYNRSSAIVVSKDDFDRHADLITCRALQHLATAPLVKDFFIDDYVYLRWNKSGKYDWYWASYCKLLPSSELAREARHAG